MKYIRGTFQAGAVALFVFAAVAVNVSCPLARASSVLHADGEFFRDPQGRAVFLRGVNVSGDSKSAPYVPLRGPDGQVDASLLDPLPGWGFNTIRLLFTWEAYEPRRGQYNEVYLDQLTRLADEAWARGIYVILDMHQDSYSRYLAGGCGEGFPAWAVPASYRLPLDTPVHDCGSMWAMKTAFSGRMHRSFRDFYADNEGVRSALLNLWSRLARHFGSHPGVIGYDLLNEPWGSEATELPLFYKDAAQAIRSEDPTAILFVEPRMFTTIFGVKKSTLPQPDFGNFAYAPHYYDPVAAAFKSWAHWRSSITRRAFHLMAEKAYELKTPLFVGEFGESAAMGNSRWFSDYQYDELDSRFASSTQWNYSPSWTYAHHDGWNDEDLSLVDDHGKLRANFSPRPFVQVLAGTPISQRELRLGDGSLRSYELEWRQGATEGETELYVPAAILARPDLYELNFAGPGLSCEPELSLSRIRCRGRSQSQFQGLMRVEIQLRKPGSKAGS